MNEFISINYQCGKKSQHELPFLNLVRYEEHKVNFAYDYTLQVNWTSESNCTMVKERVADLNVICQYG